MSITITVGKAGRVVVPKPIRDSLGLRVGSRLRLDVHGGKLEGVPEADDVRIEMKDGFPVIRGGPAVGDDEIVKAIKADRDDRIERIAGHPQSR